MAGEEVSQAIIPSPVRSMADLPLETQGTGAPLASASQPGATLCPNSLATEQVIINWADELPEGRNVKYNGATCAVKEQPSRNEDKCYLLCPGSGKEYLVIPKEMGFELRKYNKERGWVQPPAPAPSTPKPKKVLKKKVSEVASETPADQVMKEARESAAMKRPRDVPEVKCCDVCAEKWDELSSKKRRQYGKHCLFCYKVGDTCEAWRGGGVGWEDAMIKNVELESFLVTVDFLHTTSGLCDSFCNPKEVRRKAGAKQTAKQDAKEGAKEGPKEPAKEKAQEKVKEGDKEEVRPTAASDAPTVCTGDVSIPATDTPRAKRRRPDTLPAAPLSSRGDVSPATPPPLPEPVAHTADLRKRNEELEQQNRELREQLREQQTETARRLAETAKKGAHWEERAKVLQDKRKESEREARKKEGDWTQPRPGLIGEISMASGDSVYVKDDGHVFIARIEELQPKKIRVRRYMHYWAARLTEETVLNDCHPPGTRQKDLILKAEEEWVERANVLSVRCLVVEPHMMPHIWYSDKQMHPDRMKYKKASRSAPGFNGPLIAGATQ